MARQVVRACLTGELSPVFGPALLAEYEDVFARTELWRDAVTTRAQRDVVLDAFLSRCRWVEVYFAWRPNLPDEADNHLIELALAAGANVIVSKNLRDLRRGELKFPSLETLTPREVWEKVLCRH